ncbi:MAG: magnesium transporter [Actinomycetota bacterium]
MGRGFRTILAYWRAERRTILHGFVALVFASFTSLVAGVALGSITGTLEALPGLMVMVPAAIGMRGNIFGAVGSRLGTSVHAGLYEPSRRREGVLYQNIYAATVLTLAVSLVLAVLAKALSVAFGVTSISIIEFVVISAVGGILSSLVVGALTVLLSAQAYRRGWDLDSVAAPLVTAAGDMVTIPALFLATFLVRIRWVTPTIAGLAIGVSVAVLIRGLLTDLPVARRVLRQSLAILSVAATVDIFAGLVVEARLDHFVRFPALLVLIPPFLENAGSLGGILSSRLASKLHLGAMSPRGRPEGVAVLDGTIILVFALLTFPLSGLAAQTAARLVGLASPGVFAMIGVSMLAGAMATVLAMLVAYYTAVATFRRGLDPDNYGIPMITSSMDFAGVICLVIALLAFGLG